MFIWSVSNTWLLVPHMKRLDFGRGRLITFFSGDKRAFGPACQCVYCETSHQQGHLISTSMRCTVDNDHLIKSHYENPFFWSTGQSLRNEHWKFELFFWSANHQRKTQPRRSISKYQAMSTPFPSDSSESRALRREHGLCRLYCKVCILISSTTKLGSLEQVTEPL